MNEAKIADIVSKRFTTLSTQYREVFDDVETYHKMYRVEQTNDEGWQWDYKLVDPVIFYLIRSMMAKFNPENFKVRLEAKNQNEQTRREVNQQIINWEIYQLNKTLILYNFIFRGLVAGRGYLKTGWHFNKALEINTPEGKQLVMKELANRATATNIKFSNLLVANRNIPNLEEQPYVIEKMMVTYGSLLDDNETQGREVWKNKYLKKIAEQKMFENKEDYGVRIENDDTEDSFMRSQYISILRMQTLDNEVFYVPEKETRWILNTETGNEYWHGHYPYITWAPFPEDDDFYSMGVIRPVRDISHALSSTLNQYLTNARKSGNPMWIAGQSAAQTPDWMFVNRPDGIIRVMGDPNAVVPVRTPDISDTMIAMRREVMGMFERTTSMSTFYNTGSSSTGTPQLNKTATGAKVIDANIEASMQMLITLLGSQGIAKLGEHFMELNAQYITEEQQIRISDRKGVQYINISPEDISTNFDVYATADTMTKENPVVKQAQLLNLKGTIDAEKEVKFDKKPVWKAIFSAFPEMDTVEDIILDPEQQAQDAIQDLLNGVMPPVKSNMDSKTIIQLVQVFLLSNPELPPETTALFAEYLDTHRKYVEAEKVVFTLEQPLSPTDPNAMQQQIAQETSPKPDVLPTNEQDLMKSLNSQQQLASNPTESLEYKLPENVLQ